MSLLDVNPANISAALARIRDHVRETPVVEIDGADWIPEGAVPVRPIDLATSRRLGASSISSFACRSGEP